MKETNIKVEKKIHLGWQEYEDKIKGKVDVAPMFEKYQYIFTKDDNRISLVQFTPRMYGDTPWEIYQLEGSNELFEDVERFASKEEAEKRIGELFERFVKA